MRTTVTLEPDVAQKVATAVRKSGQNFKTVINNGLRFSFLKQAQQPVTTSPFKVKPFKGILRRGLDLDNIEKLLDEVEGKNRKW